MLRELTVLVDDAQAEALSDALIEAGALSVAVEDAAADSADEQPLYGEPGLTPARQAWRRSRLKVLVDTRSDAGSGPARLLAQAAEAAGLPCPPIAADAAVEDADWVRLTQAQFPPMRISDRLWVVPSWHAPPDPRAINLRLDPGVAFGTGSHPTTRLCLAWLDAHAVSGKRVLDYGCGSGILAVAAALLGAGEVVGTDIDPQALAAARANSHANGIAPTIAHYTASAGLPDPSTAAGSFDVVLANILANPLKLLAPALLARVSPGGALVLAGLLQDQADEMIALYRRLDHGVPLTLWRSEDGWACLAGTRDR
jgi:ribosomal protein L11 methyltransferase